MHAYKQYNNILIYDRIKQRIKPIIIESQKSLSYRVTKKISTGIKNT